MEENEKAIFSGMEIDAIGEIMNISLGSSATSVSGMLDRRVNITTPSVKVLKATEFHFKSYEPAIGVEITYVEGLEGTNVMILKESDVKVIVGLLLGTDYTEQEFVMDELSTSAICEVMNQMMGASSTALSQFLNRPVNISTPVSFPIDNSDDFRHRYYEDDDQLVAVYFNLIIDDLVNSEFISLLTVDLAKELVSLFGMSASEEEEPAPAPAPEPARPQPMPVAAAPQAPSMPTMPVEPPPMPQMPAQQPPQQQMPQQPAAQMPQQMPPYGMPMDPQMQQAYMQQPYMQMPQQPYMQQPYMQMPQQMDPQKRALYAQPSQLPEVSYEVRQAPFRTLEDSSLTGQQNENLGLIMSVPLKITVEIGRTRKKVREILDFSAGTVVELDKQAGSQVDIFVNGQPIAKGDVVVVDDFYGVRITQICSNQEILNVL